MHKLKRKISKILVTGIRRFKELNQIVRAKSIVDDALYRLDIRRLRFIKQIKHGEIRLMIDLIKDKAVLFWKDSKKQLRAMPVKKSWQSDHKCARIYTA